MGRPTVLDVVITVRAEDKIIDCIHCDLQPISGCQVGTIMCSFVVPLITNECQQSRLVATTQTSPTWRADRCVKVGQVPYLLRVKEEQAVKGVIPPINKALKDWVIRIAGLVKSHKAENMIKNRVSDAHSRGMGLHGRGRRCHNRGRG